MRPTPAPIMITMHAPLRLLPLISILVSSAACPEPRTDDALPAGAFTTGGDYDGFDFGESSSTAADPSTSGAPVTTTDPLGTSSGGFGELSHEADIAPLWTAYCSSDPACHDADAPQNGLDLASDGVYDRICSQFHGSSGMFYIDCTGLDPQQSYIFRKMLNTHLDGSIPGAGGGPMPPSDPLPASNELAMIAAWIEGGALP